MATREQCTAGPMSSEKKVSFACEVNTKIFLTRYRQWLREHDKKWNAEYRRLERLERKGVDVSKERSRLDRVSYDGSGVAEGIKELIRTAKVMDRMRSR